MNNRALQIKDAPTYLDLVLRSLHLNEKDSEFLSEAMKGYAAHVVSEFLETSPLYKNAPILLDALKRMLKVYDTHLNPTSIAIHTARMAITEVEKS